MTIKKAVDVLGKLVDWAYDEHVMIAARNEKENEAIETVRNWIEDLIDTLNAKE